VEEKELRGADTCTATSGGKLKADFPAAGVASKLLVLDGEFALARDVTMIFISELTPIYPQLNTHTHTHTHKHRAQLNQNYYGKLKLPSKKKKKHSS